MTASTHEWDLHITTSPKTASVSTDKNTLIVDLQALRFLAADFHDDAIKRFTKGCRMTLLPFYNGLQNIIKADIDNVVEILSALERPPDGNSSHHSNSHALENEPPLAIDSKTGLQIPKIIITLCNPEDGETALSIPYQNSAFGNQLTVPRCPALNRAHPPLVASPRMPFVQRDWTWCMGHWQATLLPSSEHDRRQLHVRPTKRRKSRLARPECGRRM